MPQGGNEAFSRVLIDKALEFSGWNLLNPQPGLRICDPACGTDGFSLDDKRTPIEANDIPDALAKWPGREEGPNSCRVPIEKIRENDWSLAAGRYKPVTTEAVNHDAPKEILGDVLKLENEIIKRGNALLRSLSPRRGEGRGEG